MSRNRRLIVLGTALFIAALFFPIAHRFYLEQLYRSAVQRAHGHGVPTTMAELESRYPEPPDDKNAAATYLRANAKLGSLGEESILRSRYELNLVSIAAIAVSAGPEWPADHLAQARRALKEQADALTVLHEAAAFPSHRLHDTYDFDTLIANAQSAYLLPTAEMSALITLEALVATEDGDIPAALHAVGTMNALARHAAAVPLIANEKFRADLTHATSLVAVRLISRPAVGTEDIETLETYLRAIADPRLLQATVDVLAISQTRYLHDSAGSAATAGPASLPLFRGLSEARNPADTAMTSATQRADIAMLESILDLEATLDAPLADVAEAIGRLDGAVLSATPRRQVHWFSSIVVPDLLRDLHAMGEASLAATACAIERYRIEQGQLPQSLADLVPTYLPAVPPAPFGEEPIGYHGNADNRFTLFSGGPKTATGLSENDIVVTIGPRNGNAPL